MTDENTTPPVVKEETLSYRKGSACFVMHNGILNMPGEFDLNMVLQVVNDIAKSGSVDLGNAVRTARHVIQQMLAVGQLTRVQRGRWTVKK